MEKNKSLKSFNTFGVHYTSASFINIASINELKAALLNNVFKNKFILGGGSNILFTKNIEGVCLHINIKGKKIIKESSSSVIVEVNAGEKWHNLVLWCIRNNFGGIENLALIPGNVGAAPIQNIGAYGVELKDVFISCNAIERSTGKIERFLFNDCNFKYRDSVFKNKLKDLYVITSVCLKLTKNIHYFKLDYAGLNKNLKGINLNLKNIAKAIMDIRKNKLPDPKKIGNCGSFFKNPIISINDFYLLTKKFNDIPFYNISGKLIKIPAAWMIEKIGLKGYRENDAGIHEKQALVIVNYGKSSGKELLKVANKVKLEVKKEFNIDLESEVNIF
tara:strand:+ start:1147 stop:2145 length:999 start_codon:yes stop_codon:yes gene_type:complete